jgi:integration host factor subunit beta
MTKSELVAALANDQKLTAHESISIINTILDTMVDALCQNQAVEIRGFGTFTIREYEPYEGRNPKTGKKIEVKKKKLPFFKVGKELKEKVAVKLNRC